MNKALCLAALAICLTGFHPAAQAARSLPHPMNDHPGNLFVAGEDVSVPALETENRGWRLVDYDGNAVVQGTAEGVRVDLGHLPVGYYELLRVGETNGLALGVIEPLHAPTPRSSPVDIDIAAAWLVPSNQIQAIANLAALAGINWARDRLNWEEMEPSRGRFAESNRYDFSVNAQAVEGLQVLEVSHRSPAWATPNPERFPPDLRVVYDYHRALARRWQGKVGAFEPWNEADIKMFGGHTGSEMASLQKAAYLGLKAGNPKVIASLNVFAVHRVGTLADLAENAAWPYFDTFNLHHYEKFENYPRLYSDFRAVSAGKPLWVTECSLPVRWSGNEQAQEPTREDLRIQSERMPITFAMALHEGAAAVFYFILPHFVEGRTQFGILRRDLSPRPAFLALAAAGRLLADARPLGRLRDDSLHAYAFDAKPDGRRAQVFVVWSDKEAQFRLPSQATACFDHLGRSCPLGHSSIAVSNAPLYVLLPLHAALPLDPPPQAPVLRRDRPSELVLQALLPQEMADLEQSAYKVSASQTVQIPLFLYNFGAVRARGRLAAEVPEGWKAEFSSECDSEPGSRMKMPLNLIIPPSGFSGCARVNLRCNFGRAGNTILSLRFLQQKE